MHVSIEPLKRSETVVLALRKDGWTVEFGQDGAVSARHPQALDEPAARSRLHGLGLLTSRSVRIEFSRASRRKSVEQGP
jgi:hypothetical protein